MKRAKQQKQSACILALCIVTGALILIIGGCLEASAAVNMDAIKKIESNGNPTAYNERSGARGHYQITEICLKHYNEVHGTKIHKDSLWIPSTNRMIADWYFSWLAEQGLDDIDQIIAYNWGIGNLMKYRTGVKDLPKETQDYITKYQCLNSGDCK